MKINHLWKVITVLQRSLSGKPFQEPPRRAVQVCVVGASSPVGEAVSFLLKQNPLVSVLHLHGERSVRGIAADLNFFDTKCKVRAYDGGDSLPKAIGTADIILLLGFDKIPENATLGDRIMCQGKRIYNVAIACTIHNPKSVIVVGAQPVSVMVPLVAGVFKKSHWYHPGRIIGSASLAQLRANSIIGHFQDMDPETYHVPIQGGPDIDLAVPLFTKATPIEVSERAAKTLLANFRGILENDFPKIASKPDYAGHSRLSEAFALNRLITTIGLGICGDEKACASAFVRSNIIQTCQHVVTTVQFARGGVIHNYGVPQLTKLELMLFEKAVLQIKEREQMANDFLTYMEGNDESQPPPFKVKEMEQRELLKQMVVR